MENIFGCIAFSNLVITSTASFLEEYPIRYICFIAVYILTSLNVMQAGV